MKQVNALTDPQVVECLCSGGIIVARTDTLYGVLARADDEHAVQRVYQLKGRSEHKSPIVLVASRDDIYDPLTDDTQHLVDDSWPGPVSVIVASTDAPVWLRRGNDSVAYRLPDNRELLTLITQTGPLIAPSANPESQIPARSIEEAYAYFGDAVDVYVDGGYIAEGRPSRLARVKPEGGVEWLR